MTSPVRMMVLASLLLCAASPAVAQFWASDTVYLPAAAHNPGVNDSLWRTDLYITNTDDVAIDVMLAFLPTGGGNNSFVFQDRTWWLGGREEEGFGRVNTALADISPDATVVLEDVIGEYWGEEEGILLGGGMVMFAYQAGTLEDDGSRVFGNAVLTSRTYNRTTILVRDPDSHNEVTEIPATYGQMIPGVPWYNLADPAAIDEDRDRTFLILTGGVQNEDYRYNVGVLNTSDPQTSVTLVLQPFDASGQPILDENDQPISRTVSLQPGAHVQYDQILSSLFGIQDEEGVLIKVLFLAWASVGTDPKPAFTTYGSMIDNRSNDPTTILPAFGDPYPVDCVWPDEESTTASGKRAMAASARQRWAPPLKKDD